MEPSFPSFSPSLLAFAASEIPTAFDGTEASGGQLLAAESLSSKAKLLYFMKGPVHWRGFSIPLQLRSWKKQPQPGLVWLAACGSRVWVPLLSFQHCVQQRCLSDPVTHSTEQMFPFLVLSDASDVQTGISKGKAYKVSCLSEVPICQFLTGRTKGRENQTPDQKALSSCFSLSAWCCRQNPQTLVAKD